MKIKYLYTFLFTLLSGVSLACGAAPTSTSAPAPVSVPIPVIVGGNDELDACISMGVVKSGQQQIDIDIRNGPAMSFSITDTLHNGKVVWLCSESDGWVGIVYPATEDVSCGVSSPINPAQPYEGKCKSGWIPQENIEVIAG